MANVNAPKGFVAKRHTDGSPFNGQLTPFLIPSSDNTAVGVGDVVVLNGSSGAAGTYVAGMDCEGMATVIRASTGTTGQNIAGIVAGFLVDPTNLNLKYRAASTNRIALVVTDPSVVYEVQEDADTTPIAAASVGLNVAFIVSSASTTTGLSGCTIDSSSVATTATLPFKILGLAKRPDNAFNTGGSGTDPAKFEVVLNTSAFMPNTAGI